MGNNIKKIGIMGGTFNPIHIGHLALAEYAMEEKGLDEVWFIPAGCPYMKHNIISGRERFIMTSLAIRDNSRMRCLDIELRRAGQTYSYETMEELAGLYPDCKFYFIVGADCLLQIETWKHPEKLFKYVTLLASVRAGISESRLMIKTDELRDGFGAYVELIHLPEMEISSTDIRRRISEGKSVRYLVPEVCIEYIKEKGFYKNEK